MAVNGEGGSLAETTAGRRGVLEFAALPILLGFGLIFSFLTPPFQVPDEPVHFFRAYAVSELQLGWSEDEEGRALLLPASLVRIAGRLTKDVPGHADRRMSPAEVRAAFAERLEPQERVLVRMVTSYTFVSYLPAAAGIAAARLFTPSALVPLYAGRLATVVIGSSLLFVALRSACFGRPVLFLLALAPMAVFQLASVSADAMTNVLAFLVIGWSLGLAFGQNPIRATHYLVLFSLAALLALAKAAYSLLPGLFLLVPVRRIGSRGCFVKLGVALIVWSGAFMLVGLRAAWPGSLWGGPPSDPRVSQLVHEVLASPARFAAIAGGDLVRHAPRYAAEFVGRLGWLDTPLPTALIAGFLLSLLLVSLTSGIPGVPFGLRHRSVLIGVLLASVAGMAALVYVNAGSPGARNLGLQGRYFIPLGPLAFLPLSMPRFSVDWERRAALLACWPGLVLAIAAACVWRRYYS